MGRGDCCADAARADAAPATQRGGGGLCPPRATSAIAWGNVRRHGDAPPSPEGYDLCQALEANRNATGERALFARSGEGSEA